MSYRGDAPANATITITLTADSNNSGKAMLTAGVGVAGGEPKGGAELVDPGKTGSVTVKTPKKGILKVVVDFTDEDDSGDLEVTGPGGFSDGETIEGDTVWTYSVEE